MKKWQRKLDIETEREEEQSPESDSTQDTQPTTEDVVNDNDKKKRVTRLGLLEQQALLVWMQNNKGEVQSTTDADLAKSLSGELAIPHLNKNHISGVRHALKWYKPRAVPSPVKKESELVEMIREVKAAVRELAAIIRGGAERLGDADTERYARSLITELDELPY